MNGHGIDAAADVRLRRRYTRLLRCYPPGHRREHAEEMLGGTPRCGAAGTAVAPPG